MEQSSAKTGQPEGAPRSRLLPADPTGYLQVSPLTSWNTVVGARQGTENPLLLSACTPPDPRHSCLSVRRGHRECLPCKAAVRVGMMDVKSVA